MELFLWRHSCSEFLGLVLCSLMWRFFFWLPGQVKSGVPKGIVLGNLLNLGGKQLGITGYGRHIMAVQSLPMSRGAHNDHTLCK